MTRSPPRFRVGGRASRMVLLKETSDGCPFGRCRLCCRSDAARGRFCGDGVLVRGWTAWEGLLAVRVLAFFGGGGVFDLARLGGYSRLRYKTSRLLTAWYVPYFLSASFRIGVVEVVQLDACSRIVLPWTTLEITRISYLDQASCFCSKPEAWVKVYVDDCDANAFVCGQLRNSRLHHAEAAMTRPSPISKSAPTPASSSKVSRANKPQPTPRSQ